MQDQAADLKAQNTDLRERLLSLTIENVKQKEKRILHESVISMLDMSRLVDDDGLPNRDAITAIVRQFGGDPKRFVATAAELGIGATSAYPQPPEGFGYSNRHPYGNPRPGTSSHKLDARNRDR